jgi:hypothetical protein
MSHTASSRLTLRIEAPDELVHPLPGDPVVPGHLRLGPPLDPDRVTTSRANDIRHPPDLRRQRCGETPVNYVLKPDTARGHGYDRTGGKTGYSARRGPSGQSPGTNSLANDHTIAATPVEAAKAVCATCPVSAECLQWALATGQDSGVWGGTSEEERRAMRRAVRPEQVAVTG